MQKIIGDFVCTYEAIPADDDPRHRGRHRVVSVAAPVVRRKKVTRGAAPDALIGSMKVYLAGAPKLLEISYDNGHLIGLSLGGPDDAYNIAPMFGWFNEVLYRKLERDIYDDQSIKAMQVLLDYDATHQAIPANVRVQVKRATALDPKAEAAMFMPFRTLEMKVPVAGPYPFDEDVRRAVAAILPATKPDAEPYAFLSQLGVCADAHDASEFSERQRHYILAANALYTQAVTGEAMLMSDDPDDPIRTLSITGGLNRPQVDHVVPRSWGGSNDFRNAMVLSKTWNAHKSAKVDADVKAILLAAVDQRPRRQAQAQKGAHRYRPY